jgi:hypothetical protein
MAENIANDFGQQKETLDPMMLKVSIILVLVHLHHYWILQWSMWP